MLNMRDMWLVYVWAVTAITCYVTFALAHT
jgi:hypothetical protein